LDSLVCKDIPSQKPKRAIQSSRSGHLAINHAEMICAAANGRRPRLSDEIREAHRVMEANEANGKMVVVLD